MAELNEHVINPVELSQLQIIASLGFYASSVAKLVRVSHMEV